MLIVASSYPLMDRTVATDFIEGVHIYADSWISDGDVCGYEVASRETNSSDATPGENVHAVNIWALIEMFFSRDLLEYSPSFSF